MNLPEISIPALNIPFDIPTLLHPPLVHFAIAIPILIVIAEILNLVINGKGVKIVTSIVMFLLIIILFGAYLTGATDGKAAIDSGFNAVSKLKEHKLLGIYLFYGSIFIFVLKLLSLVINRAGYKFFYILVLLGFLAGIIHQGKEGGELVYKYGANVKVQSNGFDNKRTSKEPLKETIKTQPQTTKQESKKEQSSPKEETKKIEEKTTILDKKVEKEKKEVEKKVEEVKEEAKKEIEKAKEVVKEVTDLNKTEH